MRTAACLGLLLIAQVAAAQSAPDVATLLQRDSTALDSFVTYRFEEEAITSMVIAGMPFDMTIRMSVSASNPGKRRMEIQIAGEPAGLFVTDGRASWMFDRSSNEYARLDDPAVVQAAGATLDFAPMTAANTRLVKTETIQIDGTPHECWVLESRTDKIALAGLELRQVTTTVWIDKQHGLSIQRDMSARMEGAPLPGNLEMRVRSIKHNLAIDEPLADSLFVFTPPPGATLNPSLPEAAGALMAGGLAGGGAFTDGGGIAGLSITAPVPLNPPSASPAPPATSISPDTPQAFVPMLTPRNRVEPTWPPGANGVMGNVELLLTVDVQGVVVAAEALTGPAELRPAAIAAARQWTFKPVLRGGRPVAAYTTQTVMTFDASQPPTAMAMNIQEEMKAMQRQEQLSRTWPRSPEQILADLENDLDGVDRMMRYAFLPQLAKAALTANAADKATLYASELLAAVGSGDWNDGNAVHDAHVVLGLLALKASHVSVAAQHLLEAGKTTGSPQLNSFGPDMALARQLLAAGERDVVLEYLALCEKFWVSGRPQLKAWTDAIRAGGTPALSGRPF